MKAELGGMVVLDFGGQYTQLIARRVREQQVFSAILPCTTSLEEIRKLEPAGIILSGGPSSVYDKDAPKCDPGGAGDGRFRCWGFATGCSGWRRIWAGKWSRRSGGSTGRRS